MDKTIGERALGPQQTVSAKLKDTVEHATQQARSIDQQKGYLKIANDVGFSLSILIFCLFLIVSQYYSKAISSQWGQKVKSFYTTTSKQVKDIHEEALRISAQEKAKGSSNPAEGEAEKPQPTTST